MFAGSVALNRCILYMLEDQLKGKIFVHEDPQVIWAIGLAANERIVTEAE